MKYVLGWGAILLFFGGLVIGGFFLINNVSTDVFYIREVCDNMKSIASIIEKQKEKCKEMVE